MSAKRTSRTRVTPVADREDMVGWYDPPQLIRTAGDVAAATIIGSQADPRMLEALAMDANAPTVHDYSHQAAHHPTRELWLDWVADTGDGWNPAYAIARAVAAPRLRVTPASDLDPLELPRARVLVIGGDLVYPTPTRERYAARFLAPFETALPRTDPPHPDFFALPGNHDWYDGLAAFTRIFCQQRWIGGWRSRQSRSYFALKLPHGWWLLATDMQLDADLDTPQLRFFTDVATQMQATDRVILCNHYPHWTLAAQYNRYDPTITENTLSFLDKHVLGGRTRVFIAGHMHYYCRHADPAGTQKITAGGGGAFLHPTHAPKLTRLAGNFTLRSSYPPPAVTRRLCFGNLAFLWKNPLFGMVTGMLYALTARAVHADLSGRRTRDLLAALHGVVRTTLATPDAGALILTLFLGLWLFTDTHARWYRFIMGTIHGLVHLLAAFLLGWGVCRLLVDQWHWPFASIRFSLVGGLLMIVGGWIAGSSILGVYLLGSLNIFGRHSNEAFSALRIEDWKSFLRLHIAADGTLSIFPLGIRRVPRTRQGSVDVEPAVELIEPTIVLPPS